MSGEGAVQPAPDAAGSDPAPASGKGGGAEEADGAGKGSTAPAGSAGLERDAEKQLATSVNNFVFNGQVNATEGVFGTRTGPAQDGPAGRAHTGKLTDDDIGALCDHFAPPPLFEVAAEALKQSQIIVLTGATGTGKTASAVALLQAAGAAPLAILSPTITLKELTRQHFDPGHGYLVEDWQDTRGASDSSDFLWRVLRDHVVDSEVHLVITVTAATASRSVKRIAWQAPPTSQVLEAYLSGPDAQAIAAEIAVAVPATYGLGSIAAVGRRLAEGEDRGVITQELSQDPARYVLQWLAAAERTDEEIGEVAALSFAVGQSERIYEAMLKRLADTLRDVGLLPDPETEDIASDETATRQDDRPRPTGLRRARATRDRPDGLVARYSITLSGTSRDILTFRQDQYHQPALEGLWRNFDMTFWSAVRDWLAELIGDTTVIRDVAVQVSVAAGLARLAHVAFEEVQESYLDPWAAGELGWSGQQTAVYVLWWMSRESPLAPVALRVATRWVNCGDPACQWTAATALSGELGVGYPMEAARRLWHLVGQSKDARPKPISALANLFATLTRQAARRDATSVLELLRERMVPAASREGDGDATVRSAQSWRDIRRNQERAMLCINAVFAVRDPVAGQPSVTSFLDACPEHRHLVAELWAVVLRNRMYRRRAMEALLAAVRGFGDVSDDPERAARALGDALSEALPVEEHRPLMTDFTNLHTHSKRRESDITATVHALLSALERLNQMEREAE